MGPRWATLSIPCWNLTWCICNLEDWSNAGFNSSHLDIKPKDLTKNDDDNFHSYSHSNYFVGDSNEKEVADKSKDLEKSEKEALAKSIEEEEDGASEMDSNLYVYENNLCHLQPNGSLLQIL